MAPPILITHNACIFITNNKYYHTTTSYTEGLVAILTTMIFKISLFAIFINLDFAFILIFFYAFTIWNNWMKAMELQKHSRITKGIRPSWLSFCVVGFCLISLLYSFNNNLAWSRGSWRSKSPALRLATRTIVCRLNA